SGNGGAARLPHGMWVGGALNFGRSDQYGSTNRFTSSGVTIGFDAKVLPDLRAGVALGFGASRTTVGVGGSRSDATNVSGMVYGSYRFMPQTFLDAVVGYGHNSFDLRRTVTFDGSTVLGNRSGNTIFGSLTLTREQKFGDLKIAPYLRFDAI